MDLDKAIVLDCEVYPNYFLVAFKMVKNNKVVTFESKNILSDEQKDRLKAILRSQVTFGYNSKNYDIPVILFALKGKTTQQIFELSSWIISGNNPGWKTQKEYGLALDQNIKHFDIMEPSPGVRVGLKLYGGRLHSKKLQDLPIEPGTILSDNQMELIKKYCINDLDVTIDLFHNIKDRLELRVQMSKVYEENFMSKSDSQIAEAIIKKQLKKESNKYNVPKIPEGTIFKYNPPYYLKFESEILNKILRFVKKYDFTINANGSVELPKQLKELKLKVGNNSYQMGIGGLHSKEKKQTIIPNENQLLIDKDVASYYPSIILNLDLYPKHLGPSFLRVYKNLVDQRIKAKREKDKIVNESLKVCINGSFGKLGSKYSVLYSPDLMIAVTLTGQLALLMLIERLECAAISVLSANTDGFVSLFDKDLLEKYQEICNNWEKETNFVLEEKYYKGLFSRDVNNYLALTSKEIKGKGLFSLNEISKNPGFDISIEAVINFLAYKVPLEKTISDCQDITKFLAVRSVTGGGVWNNNFLGKVVRWYYSKDGLPLTYRKNGNKVPKSDGSKPLMDLDGSFPQDIDYDRYLQESIKILGDLGYFNL